MVFNNLQSYMGIWPTDCGRQQLYIENLKQYLRQLESAVLNNYAYPIYLCQSIEPSQSDWELAWVEQTGLPLPIPPSANLYWLSEDCTTGLGYFGTAEGSSLVTNRIGNSSSSGIVLVHAKSEYFVDPSTGISMSGAIGSSLVYTEQTFTLAAKSKLIMEFMSYGYIIVGAAGPFAVDFLLDGQRVAVNYYDMAVGEGFSRSFEASAVNTPGSIGALAIVPDVEAGEHTIGVTVGWVDGATITGSYRITGYAANVLGVTA